MQTDRPRIVVLDGHTLNPGDLNWRELESLGHCTVYDRTASEDIVPRASEADVVLTNKTPLSVETIERLPRLRYIGVLATGYNIVNVEAARKRNIPVTNVPTYGTQSVAQMVFAHVLNFSQHVADHAKSVQDGEWAASEDWCYWKHPLLELAGLTMGIIGLGRIGRATARLADAFEMKVLAHDAFASQPPSYVTMTDLDTVFRHSDVISLHCPLTPETERLVNAERLGLMKQSAYLINTSRGPLVDEAALAVALNEQQIAGAGLDVLSVEPPSGDNPLFGARNCQLTPHIAWATRAARARLMHTAVDNVARFLEGQPENVVN